jgi:hypothetical protein
MNPMFSKIKNSRYTNLSFWYFVLHNIKFSLESTVNNPVCTTSTCVLVIFPGIVYNTSVSVIRQPPGPARDELSSFYRNLTFELSYLNSTVKWINIKS